jgi:hypothetical protein
LGPFWNHLPVIPVTDLELYEAMESSALQPSDSGVWESDTYSACSQSIGHNGQPERQTGFLKLQLPITSSNTHHRGSNTKVVFKSGNYILLTTGFEAKKFNTLHAYIAPCGTADNGD